MSENTVLRFNEVSFEYQYKKPVLDEASFTVREGSKITLMGQNGAGKSTLFSLIRGEAKPKEGNIYIAPGSTIGTARQTVGREDFALTVEEYFARVFAETPPDLGRHISRVLEAVNFSVPLERKVGDLSGGQQARLLLASALIQNPDILLLDEPTNNLDTAGIDHLIQFLVMYPKTVIVISHDADFLNCFTDGVIYLDSFTHKIESYVGDYYSVVEEIGKRIEREQRKNAQLEKQILDRKEKVNFFANKGGKMRRLANKLKEEAEELEESKVDVRRDDKTIRQFTIPHQDLNGEIVTVSAVKIIRNHEPVMKEIKPLGLRKRNHLLISGPNGIGKSTLLRTLVSKKHEGAKIMDGVTVGYYSQDFANLDFEQTVFDSLMAAKAEGLGEHEVRSVASGFLLTGEMMGHKVGDLSEGQKGLLSFARLVLMQPGLLILDEPTNHINFRHIPVIAEAVNGYEGTLIMVSHMPDFVAKVRIDETLDLGKIQ